MNLIQTAGWVFEIVLVCGGLLFFSTSVRERERRAAMLSLLSTAAAGAVWAVLVLHGGAVLPYIVIAAFAAAIFVALLTATPLGRSEPLKPVGKQERVDERDVIFSRMRMKPEDRDIYYEARPEHREVDGELRRLPDLDEPGSRFYDPLDSRITDSIFGWLGDIDILTEGQPRPTRVDLQPEEAANRIKEYARFLGADMVGVTRLDPAYIYSHVGRGPGTFGEEIALDHRYAVAVAVEMRRSFVQQAPHLPTTMETGRVYAECARISQLLARYIRSLGYPARPHKDGNYRVLCVPVAVDAGLGELSRMGYLITDRFGPRVRLGVVTTDLPMTTDEPVNLGVRDFCRYCRKCARSCPSRAIPSGDKLTELRGVRKWVIDREACYRFWRQAGTDCAICMRVCPFSKPDSLLHRTIRVLIRRNVIARRVSVIGDDMIYGKHPQPSRTTGWMKHPTLFIR